MLTDLARELLSGPNFAMIATVAADGTPHQTVVWAGERDGRVVFSTVRGRVKERDLLADPRISVLVLDAEDPYRYVTLVGTAMLEDEGAVALIEEMSLKYTGEAWVERATGARVNVVVDVEKVLEYGR
ncbi:MAG TPA: PPOX class F420-dependent oxidoreductase [Candidatus Nanopelagicales bacterium]|nr:PPOX class F420-dependent oxidoreductase [Candidatus Nanopelagicales bacterium]